MAQPRRLSLQTFCKHSKTVEPVKQVIDSNFNHTFLQTFLTKHLL